VGWDFDRVFASGLGDGDANELTALNAGVPEQVHFLGSRGARPPDSNVGVRVTDAIDVWLGASEVSHEDTVACRRLGPADHVLSLHLSCDLTTGLQIVW
jgi:hypothetical protein